MADSIFSKKSGRAFVKKHIRSFAVALGIGLVAGLLSMAMGSAEKGFIARTERVTLDFRYRIRPQIPVHPDVGFINYDDPSLALFGGWPWPRHRQVALVTMMDFYDAKAAGYDVFFSEKNDMVVMDQRLRQFIRDTTVAGKTDMAAKASRALRTSIRDYDKEFERAISKAENIYLASYVIEPDKTVAEGGLAKIQEYIEADKLTWTDMKKDAVEAASNYTVPLTPELEKRIFKMASMVPPLPGLSRASKGVGFAQIVSDFDQTVRLYPMFMYYDGKIFPSIGLVMLSRLLNAPLERWVIKPGEYVEIPDAREDGQTETRTIRIPVNENSQMLMNWAGKYEDAFLHVSFRLISEYYAYHTAKSIARQYPAEVSSYTALREEILGSIAGEQMVTDEEANRIADEIALAHVAGPILKAGKNSDAVAAEFKRAKTSIPQNAESILQALSAAFGSAVEGLDPEWRKEIERNVNWFTERSRLADVEPLFFPPTRTVRWGGQTRAFSPLDLEKKIFMIGLTGTGTIDLNPMPYESVHPMVGLHTNALNTILVNRFLKFPEQKHRYRTDMLFAIVTAVIGALTTPFIGFLGVALLISAYSYYVYWAFAVQGEWVWWVEPCLAILLTYIAIVVYHFIMAQREKGKVRAIFAAMVSPAVLKLMEENPDAFSLSGVRKPATMMFSAIERFGKVTAGVAPDELGGILSIYLTPTSEIIMDYAGYIDKYEGHVIMADFGVPIDDPGHAWKCCYAAIEQQQDIEAFKFFVRARYGAEVFTAMGINSGYISAGNMGSEKKMQYTVMGDAVNMSARFRPANNIYDTRIIAGEPTYFIVKDLCEMRMLDKLLAKGKTKAATIFEIQGWKPQAYLDLKKDAPVPPSLLSRWTKCPAEKIFGYHRFWEQREKEFSHPLIPKIRQFFESQLGVAEEIIKAEGRIEVQKYQKDWTDVRVEAAKLIGSEVNGSSFEGQSWDVLLDRWIDAAEKMEDDLEERRHLAESNPQMYAVFDTTFGRLSGLCTHLQSLKTRLSFQSGTESIVERFIVDMHEAVEKVARGGAAENIPAVNVEELESKRAAYRSAAESFFNTISAAPAEYHEMMSVAGSTTDIQKKASEIFVEGVHLHWDRKWDESIAKFRAVLELIPTDGPSKSYIERIEGYKVEPPGEKWQGEFVQKKK